MEPTGKDIAGVNVVASKIYASHLAAVVRSNLSGRSAEAAADVEHSMR